MRLDKLVKATVDALEDIKGRDIVVLDVRRMTALFDKVIVVSGDSTRQNKALANHVQDKVKALGATVYGVEGDGSRRMGAGRSRAPSSCTSCSRRSASTTISRNYGVTRPLVPRRRAAGGAR